MPISMLSIYRSREDILASMLSQLTGAIPDVYTGDDGVIHIIFDIESGQFESLYMALQLLLEDMFVSTASYQALVRHGDQYGMPMKIGTRAAGTLLFSGEDGTFIPQGRSSPTILETGLIQFRTRRPKMSRFLLPALPTPPGVSLEGDAGNLTGGYEYVLTFLTAQGETLPSNPSQIIVANGDQIMLTTIAIGGPGTTGRRVYRDKNGAGDYRLVQEFDENTTATWTDNVDDDDLENAQTLPLSDTAHSVPAQGTAQDVGVDGNAVAGAITVISDAPATLSAVTNITAFTGGSDPEDSEAYRTRLLSFIQNPQTGSVADIQAWAMTVPGVGSATVFENDPVNGTVTVRITGEQGAVASPDVIEATQEALDQLDYANITIIVESFTPEVTDVEVAVTLQSGYTLDIVTPTVQTAISNYIGNLGTGESLIIAGIIDAVFGLGGVADVTVTAPTTNLTTDPMEKRTAGVITVTEA